MDADTASLGTAGALSLQRALSTGVFGKVDHPTRDKGHLLLGRTTDDLPLPVQHKGLLVKALPLANRPGFTIELQLLGALTNQMTTQIGSIDVQFLEKNLLPIQIRADRFSYSGFGHIGWGEAHRSDEACIQIMKHVPFVSIHSHTPTLAPMTHLSIFGTNPSVLGDSFDQAGFPRLIDLHILLFDEARAISREG